MIGYESLSWTATIPGRIPLPADAFPRQERTTLFRFRRIWLPRGRSRINVTRTDIDTGARTSVLGNLIMSNEACLPFALACGLKGENWYDRLLARLKGGADGRPGPPLVWDPHPIAWKQNTPRRAGQPPSEPVCFLWLLRQETGSGEYHLNVYQKFPRFEYLGRLTFPSFWKAASLVSAITRDEIRQVTELHRAERVELKILIEEQTSLQEFL